MPNPLHQQLPLTEATFFILLSLAREAQHGYAIMKDVEQLSGGRISFSTGTLYGALRRLLDQGWITPTANGSGGGRARKAYRLTAAGRRLLAAETDRLQTLVQTAQARQALGTA
jgi:DNA-binding PadR family transcriptional regulator